MKLFTNNQTALSFITSYDSPFLILMSHAHCKGRHESREVYYHYEGNEILTNCRNEKMNILLREAGYDSKFCMELEQKWKELSKSEYIDYIISIGGNLDAQRINHE